MKFCILCIGTHGDVVPYVALGIKLKQEGHEVIVGAHEKARALCERCLLGYHPIGGDLYHLKGIEVKSLEPSVPPLFN